MRRRQAVGPNVVPGCRHSRRARCNIFGPSFVKDSLLCTMGSVASISPLAGKGPAPSVTWLDDLCYGNRCPSSVSVRKFRS